MALPPPPCVPTFERVVLLPQYPDWLWGLGKIFKLSKAQRVVRQGSCSGKTRRVRERWGGREKDGGGRRKRREVEEKVWLWSHCPPQTTYCCSLKCEIIEQETSLWSVLVDVWNKPGHWRAQFANCLRFLRLTGILLCSDRLHFSKVHSPAQVVCLGANFFQTSDTAKEEEQQQRVITHSCFHRQPGLFVW